MPHSFARRLSSILIASAAAASAAAAQSLPPVRPLAPAVARTVDTLGSASLAVPLPGGKVLVNDILRRRVVLYDSTLTHATVVADSTSSTANAYGGRTGGLIPYHGDSVLFVDPQSLSMLVIDPTGKITRVMSAPRPQDAIYLIGGPNGFPGFDSKGRLIYRSQPRITFTSGTGSSNGPSIGSPSFPDSAPIVRFDLDTRKLDTAAFFKIPKPSVSVTQGNDGRMSISMTMNPMPTVDDWALLSDGTIAVVRGKDYHIDWVSPDGVVTSSPKVPYDWQRLDDDAKAAVLDSARQAIEKQRQLAMTSMQNGGSPVLIGGGGQDVVFAGGRGPGPRAGGDAAPPERTRRTDSTAKKDGASDDPNKAGIGEAKSAAASTGSQLQVPPVNMVPASELPDYRPPFNTSSSRGDLEGNLWVRTTSPVGNDGPIYYVINRKGEVVDRVQVPQGRLIVGFDKGGVVFLAVRDAEQNVHLERARVR